MIHESSLNGGYCTRVRVISNVLGRTHVHPIDFPSKRGEEWGFNHSYGLKWVLHWWADVDGTRNALNLFVEPIEREM